MLFTRMVELPEQLPQPSVGQDADIVHQQIAGIRALAREVVVLDGARHLRCQILMHRTTRRHVDHLDPAADRQQRLPVLHGPAGQHELDLVTVGIGAPAERARLLVIGRWMQIDTAGEEYAVEPIVDGAEGGRVALQEPE